MTTRSNRALYSKDDVVEYYDKAEGLMPAEQYVFPKYVPVGSDVLDIGVGGGRTTPFLSTRAKRYLGLDYSEAMVALCQRKYPGASFAYGDATDLSSVPDESFDATIFSFNGIDCIQSDEGRLACLKEMRRVTRPTGWIVISSHNAKALGIYPELEGAPLAKKVWRLGRAVVKGTALAARMLSSRAFWRGSGFIIDPVHGGLHMHVSTPRSIASDCARAQLRIEEYVGHYFPKKVPQALNPWNTYVLTRR